MEASDINCGFLCLCHLFVTSLWHHILVYCSAKPSVLLFFLDCLATIHQCFSEYLFQYAVLWSFIFLDLIVFGSFGSTCHLYKWVSPLICYLHVHVTDHLGSRTLFCHSYWLFYYFLYLIFFRSSTYLHGPNLLFISSHYFVICLLKTLLTFIGECLWFLLDVFIAFSRTILYKLFTSPLSADPVSLAIQLVFHHVFLLRMLFSFSNIFCPIELHSIMSPFLKRGDI